MIVNIVFRKICKSLSAFFIAHKTDILLSS